MSQSVSNNLGGDAQKYSQERGEEERWEKRSMKDGLSNHQALGKWSKMPL